MSPFWLFPQLCFDQLEFLFFSSKFLTKEPTNKWKNYAIILGKGKVFKGQRHIQDIPKQNSEFLLYALSIRIIYGNIWWGLFRHRQTQTISIAVPLLADPVFLREMWKVELHILSFSGIGNTKLWEIVWAIWVGLLSNESKISSTAKYATNTEEKNQSFRKNRVWNF